MSGSLEPASPESLRRLKFVREQFFLAAVAQNIERLVAVPQPTDNTAAT
jgi:hypothetical protein